MQSLKNQKGISFVTLVLTIVLIIILLIIGFRASNQSIEKANYARFSQEIADIKKGMDTIKLINSKDGLDEYTLHRDFVKVHVKNPPDNFVSFDTNDITAYLVDLRKIDYDKIKTGLEYRDIKSGDTVTFEVDDVYVVDKLGTVYYLKGLFVEGEGVYYTINQKDINGPIVEAQNTTGGTVEVTVTPTKGGEITSVTVDGKLATKIEEGKYTIDMERNGTYLVIATEKDNGSSKTTVMVTKLDDSASSGEEIGAPTKAIIRINGGEEYTAATRATLHIDTDAEQMYIRQGGIPETPELTATGWRPVSTSQILMLSEGENAVYAWFKNPGNTTIKSAEASIILDTTPPSRDTPSVVIFNEQSFRITSNQYDPVGGSGLKKIEIGYKQEDAADFIWTTVSDVENPTIEVLDNMPGKNYIIKTKAEDNVGNTSESKEYQTGALAAVPGGIIIDYTPTSGWTRRSSVTITYPEKSMGTNYERWYRINNGIWMTAEGKIEAFNLEENAIVEAVVVMKTATQTLYGEKAEVEITNVDSTAPEVVNVEIH